jgi:hypothetical protein
MKSLQTLLAVSLLSAFAGAATVTVAPTGSCPDDIFNVQGAIAAAATSDVIQLTAGDFNFMCAGDFGGLFINKAGFVLSGSPATVIHGPAHPILWKP